jgi:protease-4
MIADLLSIRAWATEPAFAERVFPIALQMIAAGRSLDALITDNKSEASLYPKSSEYDQYSGLPMYNSSAGKRVASFRMSGVLTKSGGLCSYGMRDYVQLIERANASPSVEAIVIEMDTPGGTVDGTPELGMAIANSKKPIVVFADGLVASAGYWAASQAGAIIANANNFTQIGSIGTLFTLPNYANVVEAGNLPNVRIIRAPQSVDKARVNPFEPIPEEEEDALLEHLTMITESFISTVKAGRAGKLTDEEENIFTGKIYDASEAISLGMIDRIGTREDAIEMAAELADIKKPAPADSGRQTNNEMKFKNIAALFGLSETDQLSDEQRSASEAAEVQIEEMRNKIITLEMSLEASTNLLKESAQSIDELNTTIAERDARIAELTALLEEEPAGHATTAIHAADEFNDSAHRNTSFDKEKQQLKQFRTN